MPRFFLYINCLLGTGGRKTDVPMGYNWCRMLMDNRETRRGSPSNFVYVGNEIEVDSSVRLGMAYKFRRKMRNVPKSLLKWGIQPSKLIEGHPIVSASDLGNVAFADNFVYYVSEDASSFFPSTETKSTRSVSGIIVDPNSEDGCNIDLSEVTVDVAAIPQPSRNYIVSRRCRELVLRIFLPLLMLFALPMMNSCKEPDPQPEPTKTITFDWDWGTGLPPRDTLAYYAKQPDVKTIDLHLMPYLSDGWLPKAFHTARDSLQKGFDVSDKVKGSGTIFVSREGGPNCQVLIFQALVWRRLIVFGILCMDSKLNAFKEWQVLNSFLFYIFFLTK